jgi:hypothetical protein
MEQFFLQRRTVNINQLRAILPDLLISCNKEDGGCRRTGSQMITTAKKIENRVGNGRRLQHKRSFYPGEDAVLLCNFVTLSDTLGILLFSCYIVILSI